MNRRVVITGIGVVTPLGNELEPFWQNLLEGRSGIVPISRFDTSGYDCRIAGEVRDFDPKTAFNNPMLISNMASGLISMEFDLRGPNMCIVTACATSNNAIGEAWRIIKFG